MTMTNQTALDAQKEQDAAAAMERINKGNYWADWRLVAEGFEVGRHWALREANTNQSQGRG